MATEQKYDVFIVGAGFAGIYQLYRFAKQGYRVKLIDMARGPGGTWWWNRYPGAQSDSESFVYRYSFDKEDLKTYNWPEHFSKQPQVQKYIQHVIDRYDLEKHIQYNCELLGAEYEESLNIWNIRTDGGDFKGRYLITALGLLSKQNWPNITGIDTFQGEKYHTARFPEGYDFHNKRVGVVGCGSTGIQLITTLARAEQVKTLTCFQRRVQFTVPAGDGPVSEEYRNWVNENSDDIWRTVKDSFFGMGFKESAVSIFSVTPEERERRFQESWYRGGGLRFMFWTFYDITTSLEANEMACEFIRRKIAAIVKDPEKRRKLTPTEPWARRPLSDTGYYEQFNRPNVDIVDLKETPIKELTPKGLMTCDGKVHELDVIIFATGFDAVDGNYMRIAIKGRGGKTLQDHWVNGPTSYMGASVPDFPNFFMVTGPMTCFANIPTVAEVCVDFITELILTADSLHQGNDQKEIVLEATKEAEDSWAELCDVVSAPSLFRRANSWMFGANVEGKKQSVLFFLGGLKMFREKMAEVIANGYRGYKPFGLPAIAERLIDTSKWPEAHAVVEVSQEVADGRWH